MIQVQSALLGYELLPEPSVIVPVAAVRTPHDPAHPEHTRPSCVCVCVYMYTYMYVNICVHVSVNVYVLFMYVCMCMYKHIQIHTQVELFV
jgi:hypothetical protein